MDYVTISGTNLKLSRIGLGTVKFGRNQGIKYPHGFDLPDEDFLADFLKLAQSLGINTLDTAPSYGLSEERLGRLLYGSRKDWIIIGKAGEEFKDEQSTYNFTADHFKFSLERSLKRLNTDYLDVLLIHSDGRDMDILNDDELISTLHDFKSQGLVGAVGASTKTAAGGIKALELLDVVMATYTPDYLDEEVVLDLAAQNGKTVILKKLFSSGHTTDTDQAMQHAFAHQGTSSAIIGTINPAHLQENIETYLRVRNKNAV